MKHTYTTYHCDICKKRAKKFSIHKLNFGIYHINLNYEANDIDVCDECFESIKSDFVKIIKKIDKNYKTKEELKERERKVIEETKQKMLAQLNEVNCKDSYFIKEVKNDNNKSSL